MDSVNKFLRCAEEKSSAVFFVVPGEEVARGKGTSNIQHRTLNIEKGEEMNHRINRIRGKRIATMRHRRRKNGKDGLTAKDAKDAKKGEVEIYEE